MNIGTKLVDSDGNEFTVTGKRKDAIELRGTAGDKEISIHDLEFYTITGCTYSHATMRELVSRINRKGENAVRDVSDYFGDEKIQKFVIEEYLKDARRLLGYIEENMKRGQLY